MGKLLDRLHALQALTEKGEMKTTFPEHPAGALAITVTDDKIIVECPSIAMFLVIPLNPMAAEDQFERLIDQIDTLVHGKLLMAEPINDTKH